MGGEQSIPEDDADHSCGYRVISVQNGSPADDAQLETFFDFIVEANSVPLETESDVLMSIIQKSLGQSLRLTVYNTKTASLRDVSVHPSNSWGGSGTLGATIRFEQIQNPDEHAWHVLDVHPNSPADRAGLQPHTDYILSAVDLIFKDEGDLEYVLGRCSNTDVAFYIYNAVADSVSGNIASAVYDAAFHKPDIAIVAGTRGNYHANPGLGRGRESWV